MIQIIILTVYFVVTLAAILAVLMDDRQPSKTLAWLMVLAFLPILGIVIYFFFGRNTRKEKLISQRSLDQLTKRSMLEFAEQKNLKIPDEQSALIKLFLNQNWALPFKDNTVDIFTNGYDFFHSLLRDIGKARHHVHIDSYIFNDDALGHMVADALMAKAQQGVEVRVVYDDVGCWKVSNDFFEQMREAGIEVHSFMPVKFPAFTGKVNYRNHRKLCIVDGKTGYIGGMNIATRYIQGRNGQDWRDTHLRIRGGAVYGIQKAFLVDWYFVDRTLVSSRRYYPELSEKPKNDCLIQIVTSSPISQWPDIMQGYVRILMQAKRYVYMATPYFLPTESVLFAIRTAALAGVDVRIMIPYKTDAKVVEWASRSYVKQTVESGVKVYLYKAGFNHSKLLVSDDALCTVGSTNIDFRSFENNFEANAFIYDQKMSRRLKEVFLQDVRDSVMLEDVKDLGRRSYFKQLWESLIRLVSPLL